MIDYGRYMPNYEKGFVPDLYDDAKSNEVEDSVGILPHKYPDLQTSTEVDWTVRRSIHHIPNTPEHRINAYLESMEGHSVFKHDRMMKGEEEQSSRYAARQRLTNHFTVKPENISENYFIAKERIAREQGRGKMVMDEEVRKELAKILQEDQAQSLSRWVEYLRHDEAGYPMWFKYYVLRDVVAMGSYDSAKKEIPQEKYHYCCNFPRVEC